MASGQTRPADSPLYAVQCPVIEQPLDPSEPPATLSPVACEQQVVRKPESTSGGRFGLVRGEELVIRARPDCRCLRVLANQVRGCREPLEILGARAASWSEADSRA